MRDPIMPTPAPTIDEQYLERAGELMPMPETESKPVEHVMEYNSHGSLGPGVYCSCGAKKVHHRGKVLVNWSQKHTAKTGHHWKVGHE